MEMPTFDNPLDLLIGLIDFYQMLIIIYVIMSWIRPGGGIIGDIYRTLGTIVEPWLGIFRRYIPPIGMIDISPIVAIFALYAVQWVLSAILLR